MNLEILVFLSSRNVAS